MTSELKPCPFCGGQAERIEVREDDGFENRGGVAIECQQCRASSHVEFGRVENLVSSWNTIATPSADTMAGLVRYELHWHDFDTAGMETDSEGEYVLYSEAAEIIAAKDDSIELLESDHADVNQERARWKKRAEEAEAELAQIKAQEPVGWLHIHQDFNTEFSKQRLTGGDFDRGFREEAVYAAPVSDSLKAENERYKQALEKIYGTGNATGMNPQIMVNIAITALKGDINDKG